MTLACRVTIEGEPHEIRVDLSPGSESGDSDDLRAFVIATAYMEHFGYLPRFVVNARD